MVLYLRTRTRLLHQLRNICESPVLNRSCELVVKVSLPPMRTKSTLRRNGSQLIAIRQNKGESDT
jgi:hypothetical protein